MRTAAIVLIALMALGLFVAACSSQPQAVGTNQQVNPSNTAGDAGSQLTNSFDTDLPPDPSAQAQPTDALTKDLSVN